MHAVQGQQVVVELDHQPTDPIRHGLDQVGRVVQRQAQPLVGHEVRQMLVHAAAVRNDQAHAVRQVAVDVLVREKVHVLDPRPGVALEVRPGS